MISDARREAASAAADPTTFATTTAGANAAAPASPAISGAGTPGPAGPSPDPVTGYIEGVQGQRVYGWAWCRSEPASPVEVEIRLGGRAVARVQADVLRQDLAKAGVGDGRHGFSVLLDDAPTADDGQRITAYGRRGADDPWAPLVNRLIRDAKAPVADGEAATANDDTRQAPSPLDGLRTELDKRFAALRKDLSADLGRILAARAAAARPDAGDDTAELRRQLAQVSSSMDVLQMRMDATSAALLDGTAAAPAARRRADRALTMIVAALGVVSGAALLLGLIAVLG